MWILSRTITGFGGWDSINPLGGCTIQDLITKLIKTGLISTQTHQTPDTGPRKKNTTHRVSLLRASSSSSARSEAPLLGERVMGLWTPEDAARVSCRGVALARPLGGRGVRCGPRQGAG